MPACSDASNPSVTHWLQALQAGDHTAASRLWDFLRERLLRLAKKQLENHPRASYDEEDIALSAFASLCNELLQGSYGAVDRREELWRLLAVITLNKARNRGRDESTQRFVQRRIDLIREIWSEEIT